MLRTLNTFCKFSRNVQLFVRPCSFAVEPNVDHVLKNISSMLSCSEQTALNVYQKFPSIQPIERLNHLKQYVELLTGYGVSKDTISENPFLLITEFNKLNRKLEIIKQMQPRQIDDFLPLLHMTESTLQKAATVSAKEYGVIPENNRIYYLSRELQIEPAIVSRHCSKLKFIFVIPFTKIERKLKILLKYDIDGNQIVQSLEILRCSEKTISYRLEQLSNGSYEIYPWLFRITTDQFERFLEESKLTKTSSVDLAHRFKQRNLKKSIIMKEVLANFAQKCRERNSEKSTIISELNAMLSCDDNVSEQIYYDFIGKIDQLTKAKQNFKFLTDNGVSSKIIQENGVVLTISIAQLTENMKMIKDMRPNAIEDFLPLVEVDSSVLKDFAHQIDQYYSRELHPIYYLSDTLKIDPTVTSQYVAKHTRFLVDFVELKEKIELLESFNVRQMKSILQSPPHIFDMSYETLECILNDLKSQGNEKISPRMLLAEQSKMQKEEEEKELWGEPTNTIDYIAKRLNWDVATRVRAFKRSPSLANCSVSKAKAMLDYLLNETNFTIDDINSYLTVFTASTDELRLRMNELTAIGFVPHRLYMICTHRTRYLEMVERFCVNKNCPDAFESFKLIEKRVKNTS